MDFDEVNDVSSTIDGGLTAWRRKGSIYVAWPSTSVSGAAYLACCMAICVAPTYKHEVCDSLFQNAAEVPRQPVNSIPPLARQSLAYDFNRAC